MKHKASSTRTMFSHLLKYLNSRDDYNVSDKCRLALLKYIESKGKQEPVNQAKVFSIDEIRKIFSINPSTVPQIRDKIIFVLGVCTLARSSELCSLKVQDLDIVDDGVYVKIMRKKAAVCRSVQKIWVNKSFFGWDLLANLRKYLQYIPSEGSLWRTVAPNPRGVETRVLAHTTVDETAVKMARLIHLPDEKQYHSHTLRRTGATLLAIMGRTEEQIMIMGNWSSSTAARRYICTSEVTMRANGKAIALAGEFSCNLVENSAPSCSAAATAAAGTDVVTSASAASDDATTAAAAGASDDGSSAVAPTDAVTTAAATGLIRNDFVLGRTEQDDTRPPSAKMPRGNSVVFTGWIQQLVMVNKVEDIPNCPNPQ